MSVIVHIKQKSFPTLKRVCDSHTSCMDVKPTTIIYCRYMTS